ncbi:MAG TPA: glycoside hydrolase family 38 C-terminal domain-containing protein [Clostridiales bacterium]|nr:MAG: Mannosylglycerate hydrolase [Firmicutes bacterium ADurb.Bin262]HOU10528.1 glycoside hydrolase family 38 C-terminal domain-containing protein [Clostridiales bacterium]HQH62955.1 glycoside hydrolase family 38 C-terminal domain-containing protein [Clostridiales bacterium]HQK72727.1 glycoside hydrolase family 38 C-terminal domain-containing protein [Clostridiales bacterium]
MPGIVRRLDELFKKTEGPWSERILAELDFALRISKNSENGLEKEIETALDALERRAALDGFIGQAAAEEAEKMLAAAAAEAKKYTLLCASHAHIDMNWMWGYNETVAVTLDTFRTMLRLMDEYEDFTFSQSQASVYEIVAEHDPEMLEEIKRRVKEGRWEVTASTWVETDKNMPCGESLARHILYTKRYLSGLLDIDPETLNIDFEPDTFGHNVNVPEILSNAGVKYYYHCRGYDALSLYRWESPSGNAITVYREPLWYNSGIDSTVAELVADYCIEHGLKTMLKVYGVGDHGGGPTRRDIEKLIDMSRWPVFPTIRFGTFREFFKTLDAVADTLPVVKDELNFIFTGCYTSQSRIKMSNRIIEGRLNEAEQFAALAAKTGTFKYRGDYLESAWRCALFNHFHDILPGSGVIDTREFALGRFQQAAAAANTTLAGAMRHIASLVDTSRIEDGGGLEETVSEGAGAGFSATDYGVSIPERGRGKTRIYHLFNPSPRERTQTAELIVWDWPGDLSRLKISDGAGDLPYQVVEAKKGYWGHDYAKLLVFATVPACGYATLTLGESEPEKLFTAIPGDPRVDRFEDLVLENELVRAVFDNENAALLSFTDKKTGRDLIDPSRPAALFRVIEEDDSCGMTSWRVGRYMKITNIDTNVKMKKPALGGGLRKQFSYSAGFGASRLDVTVSLDRGSRRLAFEVECDWQERPVKGKFVPQLNFTAPVAYSCSGYRYDIAYGTLFRNDLDSDVPAVSWGLAVPQENGADALMLISKTKYGFRGTGDSLSLALIRSSYDPDPYPENIMHRFGLALELVPAGTANLALAENAYDYNHPLTCVAGTRHAGSLPAAASLMRRVEGSAAPAAVKLKESGDGGLIVRVYETDGKDTEAVFEFFKKPVSASFVDINENTLEGKAGIRVAGHRVTFPVPAYGVASVCVEI